MNINIKYVLIIFLVFKMMYMYNSKEGLYNKSASNPNPSSVTTPYGQYSFHNYSGLGLPVLNNTTDSKNNTTNTLLYRSNKLRTDASTGLYSLIYLDKIGILIR